MASTPTTRNGFEKIGPGEQNNGWGGPNGLNRVLDLVDAAIDGMTTVSAAGATTLTSFQYVANTARPRFLNVTAVGPATITIPSVEKSYIVRAASANVTITTGGATTATILAGDIAWVVCDGAAVRKVQSNDFGGAQLTNLADPTSAQSAATKAYADALAFAALDGDLPGQTGNAGNFLGTNGTVAAWGPALPHPIRKTANYTASDKDRIEADTTSAAFTITLPASPAEGDYVQVWDGGATDVLNGWATNKITIARNSSSINGLSQDVECNTKGAALTFEYLNSTWRVRIGA
jgi:hypothetical protein